MSEHNRRLVILIFFGFLNLFILFYLNYMASQERQMIIANQLYTTWSAELEEGMEWNEITQQLPRHSRIFFEHSENGNIRSFYQNGNWVPPMESGEFFTSESPLFAAVVGNHYLPENEAFITIDGTEFEIIGVLSAGYPSALDRLVLLNQPPSENAFYRIVMDGQTLTDVETFLEIVAGEFIHESRTAVEFLGNEFFDRVVVSNVLIISLLLIGLICIVYDKLIKCKNEVFYLMGTNRIRILLINTIELILLYVLSMIVIAIIDLILGHQSIMISWHLYMSILFLTLVGNMITFNSGVFWSKGGIFND